MKKYNFPYFGDIDLNEEEDFFEVDASIGEVNFNIELDFEGEEPSVKSLDRVKQFLSQLPLHIDKSKLYINQEFDRVPGFVSDYISFFKESIEENGDVDTYIDENNPDKSTEEQLLDKFYLLRIGIYPNGDALAIFDYTIDDEYTDDLLVVYMTDEGELYGMTIEN